MRTTLVRFSCSSEQLFKYSNPELSCVRSANENSAGNLFIAAMVG